MKTRIKTGFFVLLLSLVPASSIAASIGQHKGEKTGIEVKALFSGHFGSTITDDSGTYFNINSNSYMAWLYKEWFGIEDYDPWHGYQVWSTTYEPVVYVKPYQFGSTRFRFTPQTTVDDVLHNPDAGVPLYFFDMPAGITLAITHHGPQARMKLRVSSEAFVLNPDGSNGPSFGNHQVRDIVVLKGETVLIDASFTAIYREELSSGLDRLAITVSHPNSSGQDGAGVIAEYEAIYCPPEYREDMPLMPGAVTF